jgi:energy-converting hydrogenase Eha subunit B
MKRAFFALFVVVVVALPAFAQRNEGFFMRDAVGVKSYAAAPRLAERAAMVPAVVLPESASTMPEAIAAIQAWNRGGHEPMRNGFRRMLPDVIDMRLSSAIAAKTAITSWGRGVVEQTARGTIVWSTVVRVDKADRLRLHLENASLPDGATLWVYAPGHEPTAFGKELMDDKGGLWTPSVVGDTIYLDVEVPAANAASSFTIREVLELLHPSLTGVIQPNDSPTCLVDATCVTSATFDVIANARKAISHLEFVTPQGGAVCSGGLLNDINNTGTPYLLTANHCFQNQTVASTIEAYFDFTTTSCNGSFNGANAPHTNGATFLAGSSNSDFTFIRLNSVPAGRYFLGWDSRTSVVGAGVKLHRISHPVPADTIFPQMYSNTTVNATTGTCTNYPRPNFLYSDQGQGGVYGGSSGSPVLIAGGYVVGQLLGSCGPDPSAGCDARNSTVDGAFSQSYSSISSFLQGNPAQPTVCTQDATTLCLSSGRFAVTSTWRTNDGASGAGQAVRLTSDTGYFTFFSATNVEAVVKVLNACGLNQKYWVFAGGLTNVNVVITVRDTQNGTVKTYTNPANTAFQPIQDTNAFATCP